LKDGATKKKKKKELKFIRGQLIANKIYKDITPTLRNNPEYIFAYLEPVSIACLKTDRAVQFALHEQTRRDQCHVPTTRIRPLQIEGISLKAVFAEWKESICDICLR